MSKRTKQRKKVAKANKNKIGISQHDINKAQALVKLMKHVSKDKTKPTLWCLWVLNQELKAYEIKACYTNKREANKNYESILVSTTNNTIGGLKIKNRIKELKDA